MTYQINQYAEDQNSSPADNFIERTDPNEMAEHFLAHGGCGDIVRWRDNWYRFTGNCYQEVTGEGIDAMIRSHLRDCWTFQRNARGEIQLDKKSERQLSTKVRPTVRMVGEVRAALPSVMIPGTDTRVLLSRELNQPFILPGESLAGDVIACANGVLDLDTCDLSPATPDLFTTNALPVPFDPFAIEPTAWHTFLNQLWPNDPASIFTLQEWFGYTLTPWTSLQKMFMLVGPKRSGKGTIARILNAILGPRNVCGPTMGSLGTNFGLQSWLDKLLAVMSDARLSGKTDQSLIVENLLRISGEDHISVDRKHQPALQVQLPTRVMVLTNELPRLADTSGALASRFITLTLTQSFYGKEDTHLTDKLLAELPGILNWAIEGRKRLKDRGAFIQPDSGADAMQELEELSSPISAFVRDECEVGPGMNVGTDELYRKWRDWCDHTGRDHPGTIHSFGRNLKAAVPGVETKQRQLAGHRFREFEGIRICSQ